MSTDPYEPDGALRKCRYCGRHEPEHAVACESQKQKPGTVAEMREAAQWMHDGCRFTGETTLRGWADELEAAIDSAIDAQSDVANVIERNKELEGELEAAQHDAFNLRAQLAVAERRCEKAEAFKAWVHGYLDSHGVPYHPLGIHGAEGCRIGDRMDWLMNRITQLEAAPEAVGVPQFLCQEYTGKWHAFESRRDGEHFKRLPGEDHGYTRQTVSEWIWHSATSTEGAADGNSA